MDGAERLLNSFCTLMNSFCFRSLEKLVDAVLGRYMIGLEEKAIRLDPRNRDYYVFWEAMAYTLMGRYAEAIPLLKQHFTRYPNDLGSHVVLIIDYIELRHEQEARAEAAEVLRISPHFSLDMWRQRSPQKNRALLERNLADLRKAGLK